MWRTAALAEAAAEAEAAEPLSPEAAAAAAFAVAVAVAEAAAAAPVAPAAEAEAAALAALHHTGHSDKTPQWLHKTMLATNDFERVMHSMTRRPPQRHCRLKAASPQVLYVLHGC